QWLEGRLDQRTDIYAYGCILYEMFSGGRLFPARTIEEWRTAHMGHLPVRMPADRQVPASVEAFIFRCLIKNPGIRPQNWDVVVAECARWYEELTGEPAQLDCHGEAMNFEDLRNASFSLYRLRKFPELIEVCDRILEIDPRSTNAWHHKGFSLE